MKTLLLARHAKSDWGDPGLSDFDRPLNDRGNRDAPVMANFLKGSGVTLDRLISSDAKRALASAEFYRDLCIDQSAFTKQSGLYLALDESIIQQVEALEDAWERVMLVGHNPGISQVLAYFIPGQSPHMPTCSVAIIEFDIDHWSGATPRKASLVALYTPKSLREQSGL